MSRTRQPLLYFGRKPSPRRLMSDYPHFSTTASGIGRNHLVALFRVFLSRGDRDRLHTGSQSVPPY